MIPTRRDFLKIAGLTSLTIATTNPFSMLKGDNPIYLPKNEKLTTLLNTLQSSRQPPQRIILDSDDLVGIAALTGDLSIAGKDSQRRTYAACNRLAVERYGLQGRFKFEEFSGDKAILNYYPTSAAA